MPFCPYCGTQLQPQHRFCINCGKPVESAPPPPAPQAAYPPPPPQAYQQPPPAYAPQPAYPPPPAGERVQTVLAVMKKMKFLGQFDAFNVVVTDRRTIFAQLTNDMLKKAGEEAVKQAKGAGKGFFDQWGSQMDASLNYWRRYLEMSPDAILAEQPGNFAVEHTLLREVKVNVHQERVKVGPGNQLMHHTEAEWKYPSGSLKLVCDGDVGDKIREAYGGKAR